jgi:hypothetical protein
LVEIFTNLMKAINLQSQNSMSSEWAKHRTTIPRHTIKLLKTTHISKFREKKKKKAKARNWWLSPVILSTQ